MTKQDLFGMEIGNYNLSDDIENYFYDLEIGLLDNGERYYKINEKGYFNRGYFFMVEDYEKDEDGVIYKILSVSTHIGGIFIHSNDTYSMLKDIKLL